MGRSSPPEEIVSVKHYIEQGYVRIALTFPDVTLAPCGLCLVTLVGPSGCPVFVLVVSHEILT